MYRPIRPQNSGRKNVEWWRVRGGAVPVGVFRTALWENKLQVPVELPLARGQKKGFVIYIYIYLT